MQREGLASQTRSSLPLGPAATDSVHGEVTGSEDVVVIIMHGCSVDGMLAPCGRRILCVQEITEDFVLEYL